MSTLLKLIAAVACGVALENGSGARPIGEPVLVPVEGLKLVMDMKKLFNRRAEIKKSHTSRESGSGRSLPAAFYPRVDYTNTLNIEKMLPAFLLSAYRDTFTKPDEVSDPLDNYFDRFSKTMANDDVEESVNKLLARLEDVRKAAVEALGKLAPKTLAPALREREGESPAIAPAQAKTLAPAHAGAPALVARLEDETLKVIINESYVLDEAFLEFVFDMIEYKEERTALLKFFLKFKYTYTKPDEVSDPLYNYFDIFSKTMANDDVEESVNKLLARLEDVRKAAVEAPGKLAPKTLAHAGAPALVARLEDETLKVIMNESYVLDEAFRKFVSDMIEDEEEREALLKFFLKLNFGLKSFGLKSFGLKSF